MLNRSERLDRRITIERATTTANALNEPVQTWAPYGVFSAGRSDVSDGEKAASDQVGAFRVSRFVLRCSPDTLGIRPTDRIVYNGLWNIHGIKETADGRNRFLEITASLSVD